MPIYTLAMDEIPGFEIRDSWRFDMGEIIRKIEDTQRKMMDRNGLRKQ